MKSTLKIFVDNQEIQFNTNTIGQAYLEEIIGTLDFFRSYRCVSDTQGINLLNMGIVTLRKSMMSFIESYFTNIRTSLLTKKLERERYSVDKKLCKHYLSTKRKCLLETGLNKLMDIKKELQNGINDSRKAISKVEGEISAKKRIISYKEAETKKAEEGICPILKTTCDRIGKKMTADDKSKLFQEIEQLSHEIEQLEESIIGDNDYLADLEIQMQETEFKIEKTRRKAIRLESAFQFKDYKYTKADIVIYDEAIKILDNFAGEYIKEWLSNLSIIINNLLQPINLSVEFTADKEFMYVKDNDQILKYNSLSSGQQTFLGCIFKLAILLNQNQTGMIILDDGLGNLDFKNFKNLLEIIKTLPFQIIAVYQNNNETLPDIKYFNIIRQNGESKIEF